MHLSIIIPTRNRCSLLQEAISSVMRQNVPACEVIVCDDGSTDDMSAVRDNILASESRIVWSRTEKCHGAQVARNRGLALAQGEAVLFMDSDDVLVVDGIRFALEQLERNNCDFVYGKVQKTDEALNPIAGALVGSRYSMENRDLAGYHWHTMGAIYRRELLERVGPWNELLTGSQDWEFQARVKLHARSSAFCDTIMGLWRQHQSDRVGARAFRHDYTQSVVEACLSIAQHAKEAGRYDRSLANRLAGKMFLHGLEFSVHGFADEARRTFSEAKLLPEISLAIKALMSVFAFSPRLVNWCAFRAIRAIKG